MGLWDSPNDIAQTNRLKVEVYALVLLKIIFKVSSLRRKEAMAAWKEAERTLKATFRMV